MTVRVTVEGVKQTRAFLNKKKIATKVMVNRSMVKAGAFMDGEVKSSIAGQRAEPASVDTGNFLRSVAFQAFSDNAVIFSNVSYARFLEFGTSSFTGRRHFNNSKDRNKKKIASIINKEVRKI